MRAVRAILSFLYDFIVGDDWKIAAAVVVSLGASAALLTAGDRSDTAVVVLGSVLLVAAFCVAMVVDVRRSSR